MMRSLASKGNNYIKTFIFLCGLTSFLLQINVIYRVTKVYDLSNVIAYRTAGYHFAVKVENEERDVTSRKTTNDTPFRKHQDATKKSLMKKNTEQSEEPKNRLILHVGPPKTGTTTVQNGLYKVRNKLKGMDKYVYLARRDDIEIDRDQFLEEGQLNLNTSAVLKREKRPSFVWQINPILNEFKNMLNLEIQDGEEEIDLVGNQGINYVKGWKNVKLLVPPPRKSKRTNGDSRTDRLMERMRNRRDSKRNEFEDDVIPKMRIKKLKNFNRLIKKLDKTHDYGFSVIISAEQFCFNDKFLPDHPKVWDIFLPPLEKWDVHVVVAYRRYYEWITSYYFQFNSVRFFATRKQTLAEFVENVLEQSAELNQEGRFLETHPTFHVYSKFKRHFDQIHVMNLHENTENDAVTKFVCEVIPDAVHTCSYLASSKQEAPILRKSRELDFDLLIQGAIDREALTVIYNNKHFEYFSKAASDFHKDEYKKPLPYKCLSSETTERIYDISVTLEKEIVPDFYANPVNQKVHREGFLEAVANNKFCDIDIDAVFQLKEWRIFFERNNNIGEPENYAYEKRMEAFFNSHRASPRKSKIY